MTIYICVQDIWGRAGTDYHFHNGQYLGIKFLIIIIIIYILLILYNNYLQIIYN